MTSISISSAPRSRARCWPSSLPSYLMIVIDISIVITALPKMRESLSISPAHLSWVHNAYILAFGGLLLLGARVK